MGSSSTCMRGRRMPLHAAQCLSGNAQHTWTARYARSAQQCLDLLTRMLALAPWSISETASPEPRVFCMETICAQLSCKPSCIFLQLHRAERSRVVGRTTKIGRPTRFVSRSGVHPPHRVTLTLRVERRGCSPQNHASSVWRLPAAFLMLEVSALPAAFPAAYLPYRARLSGIPNVASLVNEDIPFQQP